MSRRMAFLHLPPIRWLTSFYNPPNYSLYFIFQLLQHTKFIKEGHARHYISVVQKQTVRIPPSYEEQESISDTFSRIQSLIKLQQNKIDQYTTLKKYLLQKIFI